MNMKKFVKLIVAVVLLAMLSVACNHYICPAYTSEKADEAKVTQPS